MRSQLSFRALQARATTASRCLPSPVAPFRGWPEPCPPARATVNARATEDARARATSRARSFDCLATGGAPRGTATVHERARSSPDTHGAMGRDSTAQVSRRGCRVTRRLFATWEPVRGSRRGRAPSSGREPRPWTRLRLCRRIPPCPGAQGLGCSPAGTAATASCPRAPANPFDALIGCKGLLRSRGGSRRKAENLVSTVNFHHGFRGNPARCDVISSVISIAPLPLAGAGFHRKPLEPAGRICRLRWWWCLWSSQAASLG